MRGLSGGDRPRFRHRRQGRGSRSFRRDSGTPFRSLARHPSGRGHTEKGVVRANSSELEIRLVDRGSLCDAGSMYVVGNGRHRSSRAPPGSARKKRFRPPVETPALSTGFDRGAGLIVIKPIMTADPGGIDVGKKKKAGRREKGGVRSVFPNLQFDVDAIEQRRGWIEAWCVHGPLWAGRSFPTVVHHVAGFGYL